MSPSNPPRLPVLPQFTRMTTPLATEARSRPVLQSSRAPAQLSLFPRPFGADLK